MIRKLKRACGIRFSVKALVRNPGIQCRQAIRRHRSFSELLETLADDRQITVVQIGANDGRDALGDLMRRRNDRIKRALLIEPQRAAFARLVRQNERFDNLACINAAIDRQTGKRTLYSVKASPDLGDGIASFDRRHVEQEIANNTSDQTAEPPIESETAPVSTLQDAAANADLESPDVLMVDTEGFDAEIVRMAFEAGWFPALLQYEHKHLSRNDRNSLAVDLRRRGYLLWSDHSDVWGVRSTA